MSVDLHFEERGTGESIILLHGNGEDCSYFKHQIGHFSATHHVIAVDTRGHGLSPRGTAPFTIRQFADDLADLMDKLQIARADILGFSDGGNIALVFALKYPGRVHRLIVNGANLYPIGMKTRVLIPIEIEYLLARLVAPLSKRAKFHAELLRLMTKDPDLSPEELASIAAPTLVIAGTHDMIRDEHTRLIAQSIPNSTLAIIKGDHFIAAKKPHAFNSAVEKFLARNE